MFGLHGEPWPFWAYSDGGCLPWMGPQGNNGKYLQLFPPTWPQPSSAPNPHLCLPEWLLFRVLPSLTLAPALSPRLLLALSSVTSSIPNFDPSPRAFTSAFPTAWTTPHFETSPLSCASLVMSHSNFSALTLTLPSKVWHHFALFCNYMSDTAFFL